MDRELLRKLYIQATDECIELGKNDTWLWEEKFAEAIIKECTKQILELQQADPYTGELYINEYNTGLKDAVEKLFEVNNGI